MQQKYVAMYDYATVEPKDSTNQKAIVYLHNNQVGQVQYAFNSDGQMIYERVQTPFGETMGEINAYDLQMPVRFPGQYYDAETGFNQNWNRDYDSTTGRYVQSDPIGLEGGINTYGYVGQSPLMWVDPMGLLPSVEKSDDTKSAGDRLFDWCVDELRDLSGNIERNQRENSPAPEKGSGNQCIGCLRGSVESNPKA